MQTCDAFRSTLMFIPVDGPLSACQGIGDAKRTVRGQGVHRCALISRSGTLALAFAVKEKEFIGDR